MNKKQIHITIKLSKDYKSSTTNARKLQAYLKNRGKGGTITDRIDGVDRDKQLL